MVAFLTAAAFSKSGFNLWEWWIFVIAGAAWITWFARGFLSLHLRRFTLEANQDFCEKQLATVAAQSDLLRAYRELLKTTGVGPVAPQGPDEQQDTNKQQKVGNESEFNV
jgi:hypothetical protein